MIVISVDAKQFRTGAGNIRPPTGVAPVSFVLHKMLIQHFLLCSVFEYCAGLWAGSSNDWNYSSWFQTR